MGALAVGDRTADTARRRWAALPAGDPDRAIAGTDPWDAHRAAVPDERHARAGTEAGLTCGIERF